MKRRPVSGLLITIRKGPERRRDVPAARRALRVRVSRSRHQLAEVAVGGFRSSITNWRSQLGGRSIARTNFFDVRV